MATPQHGAVRGLNDVIATCHDAEEGYAKAAKGLHDHELSDRLTAISGERGRFAAELAEIVSRMGQEPAKDAHFGGILHSGWMDLETRIRPKDEHDILQNCHRGDETTLKHYDHALSQQRLDDFTRAVLDHQREQVRSDLSYLEARLKRHRAQHA